MSIAFIYDDDRPFWEELLGELDIVSQISSYSNKQSVIQLSDTQHTLISIALVEDPIGSFRVRDRIIGFNWRDWQDYSDDYYDDTWSDD